MLRELGRREMPAPHDRDHTAIHFLGKRRFEIVTAKARLDVADWYSAIESAQRCDFRGRRIALDQNGVRPLIREQSVDRREQTRAEARQGLLGLHHAQVNIGLQVKIGEGLFQHFLVLAAGAERDIECVQRAQRTHDRHHLDRFRSRAGKNHYFLHGCRPRGKNGTDRRPTVNIVRRTTCVQVNSRSTLARAATPIWRRSA